MINDKCIVSDATLTSADPALSSEASARDVVAETAALSLAGRRGKAAPSVETKLTDAWLGFYVALTKNSNLSSSAATTEVATEGSLSEVASSHGGLSPRRVADGEIAGTACQEDCSINACGKPSEGFEDILEEQTPTKRSRRSHRRRRTRGKGKKNAAQNSEANVDDDCVVGRSAPMTPMSPLANPVSSSCFRDAYGGVMSTSPKSTMTEQPSQWPFQGRRLGDHCPAAVLRADPLLMSPAKLSAAPTGIIGTSPDASRTPTHCEASARTPQRISFCNSPVAQMMPTTPVGFGTPTGNICHTKTGTPVVFGTSPGRIVFTGGHAAYQGTHVVASPAAIQVSPSFASAAPAAPTGVPPTHQLAQSAADPLQSWLTGGLTSCGEDLAKKLQAAAPETYED